MKNTAKNTATNGNVNANTVPTEKRVTLTQGTRAQWESMGVALNTMGSWVGRDNVSLSSCKWIADNYETLIGHVNKHDADCVAMHITEGAKGAHTGLCMVYTLQTNYTSAEKEETVTLYVKWNGTMLLSDTVQGTRVIGTDEAIATGRKFGFAEVRFDTRADSGSEWQKESIVRGAWLGSIEGRYQGLLHRDSKGELKARVALLKDAKEHETGRAVIVRAIGADGSEGKALASELVSGVKAKKAQKARRK